jgi:hypothetical protein
MLVPVRRRRYNAVLAGATAYLFPGFILTSLQSILDGLH